LCLFHRVRAPSSEPLEILRGCDITFGNLEGPFVRGGDTSDKWTVIGQEPGIAREYAKMGFHVMSVANNHMFDYGLDGFLTTLDMLDKVGIRHVGGGRDLEEAAAALRLDRGSLRVAFLGCASTLPGDSAASAHKPGVAPLRVRALHYVDLEMEREQPGTPPVIFTEPDEDDLERMRKAIRRAREVADYIVVSIHWGVAYQEQVVDYQPRVGRSFIDSGADLVVGHHPHRLQGIERYRNGLIFYSLGNFFFERHGLKPRSTKWRHWPPKVGMWEQSDDSFILKSVLKPGEEAAHELIPISRDSSGPPFLLKGARARRLLAHLSSLSEGRGVRLSVKDCRATIE